MRTTSTEGPYLSLKMAQYEYVDYTNRRLQIGIQAWFPVIQQTVSSFSRVNGVAALQLVVRTSHINHTPTHCVVRVALRMLSAARILLTAVYAI